MGTDGLSLTFIALFLPFIAAVAAPFLTQRMGHKAAWVLALVPAFLFLHFATYVGTVASGGIVTGGHAWIPSLGVDFSWLLDGLSLTFALLISGIGTFIVLYSGGYLKGHAHQGRFFSFMLMFMGAMQGLVISDSFLMFFVLVGAPGQHQEEGEEREGDDDRRQHQRLRQRVGRRDLRHVEVYRDHRRYLARQPPGGEDRQVRRIAEHHHAQHDADRVLGQKQVDGNGKEDSDEDGKRGLDHSSSLSSSASAIDVTAPSTTR